MVAIIGPNGGGKTSLLRALAGIEIDDGRVAIGGEDIAAAPPGTPDDAFVVPARIARPDLANSRRAT